MKKNVSRRDVLKAAAVGGLALGPAAAAAGLGAWPLPATALQVAPKPAKMPVVFVSHGSPMAAVSTGTYAKTLRKMGESLPKPKAVVMVSAHWMGEMPVRITGAEKPPMIYDFGGFPKALYEIDYPAPGDPKLAADIAAMLVKSGIQAECDAGRGFDHGAWVPMRLIYPGADIPTLQVTLCSDMAPADLLKMGATLAPLRERGVLIVGSGGWTHNLVGIQDDEEQIALTKKFDAWAREKLDRFDVAGLAQYREKAPGVDEAHPTTEHWDVIFPALGACSQGEKLKDIIEGARGGPGSLRTFTVG